MKLAHSVYVTPGRCGLYESTHDLITALRRLGVDARIFDPKAEESKMYPHGLTTDDRGVPFADVNWAKKADFLVNHSGLGKTLAHEGPPVIHMSHGRPKYSFLLEQTDKVAIYSYQYKKSKDKRYKAVVTFWPEHKPYMEVNWPDTPVHVIPAPVNIDRWTNDGPSGYQFGGRKADINLVCADSIREDNDPFIVMNAAILYARYHKGTKLHLYAAPEDTKAYAVLYRKMREEDCLGEVKPWVSGLEHVYRAADCVLTAVPIATRIVRESMACGCPVAAYTNDMNLNTYVRYINEIRRTPREQVRKQACAKFDSVKSAMKLKEIAETLCT